MRHYTQLTQEERYQIAALMKAGHTQSEIARLIGRHKSTISRELARNTGQRGYRPHRPNSGRENASITRFVRPSVILTGNSSMRSCVPIGVRNRFQGA
jgi:IS30 family transposase